MKNAEVSLGVFDGTKKQYIKPLTEEEQKVCDYVLDGMTYYDAAMKAGIYAEYDKPIIQDKVCKLLKTKRARKYLAENSKTVKLFVDKDMDIIRVHMFEIAMGTAKKKSVKVTKDGDTVEIEETPGFRDQIAAAAWLSSDVRERKQTLQAPVQELIVGDIEEIDQKTSAFLEKYSYRDTEKSKLASRMENIIDVEPIAETEKDMENISREDIDRALREDLSEYTVHG